MIIVCIVCFKQKGLVWWLIEIGGLNGHRQEAFKVEDISGRISKAMGWPKEAKILFARMNKYTWYSLANSILNNQQALCDVVEAQKESRLEPAKEQAWKGKAENLPEIRKKSFSGSCPMYSACCKGWKVWTKKTSFFSVPAKIVQVLLPKRMMENGLDRRGSPWILGDIVMLVMQHFLKWSFPESGQSAPMFWIIPTAFKRKQGKMVFANRTNIKNLFSAK